ncbi:MAG TPA: thrombospondin type 3 repeat-containing protein, partial [Candidatus Cybelea sp.]|nr:thrombospondin type 3 repeat-containing protein [Candidatus Cybelea sp.]
MRQRVFLSFLGMFLFAFGMGVAHARIIDLNHNGMSDIWEWLYNAYGIAPNADPDGDGFSDTQEAIAGTDPFNSNSFPY